MVVVQCVAPPPPYPDGVIVLWRPGSIVTVTQGDGVELALVQVACGAVAALGPQGLGGLQNVLKTETGRGERERE